MPRFSSVGGNRFGCRPPLPNKEALQVMKDVPTPVVMLCTNQSYGIAIVADGRSVEWGQGLCGEVQLQPTKDCAIVAKSLGDCNDDEKAALPLLPPPRFLRGARLPLISLACGGGHVLAAVGCGGVLCWGAGIFELPLEFGVTSQRLQTLGLGGCLDPLCCACADYGRKRRRIAEIENRDYGHRSSQFGQHSYAGCGAESNEEEEVEECPLPVQVGNRAWWVAGLRDKDVVSVAAGHMFSAAIVREHDNAYNPQESTRVLYTWGNGESGQLGLGLAHAEAEANAEDFFATGRGRFNGKSPGSRQVSETCSVTLEGETPAQAAVRRRAALLSRAALPSVFNVSCTPQRVTFPAQVKAPPKPRNAILSGSRPRSSSPSSASSSSSSSSLSISATSFAASSYTASSYLPEDVVPSLARPKAQPIEPESVACGPYHAACVDSQGRLFTFGAGARGQLGHGSPLRDAWAPRQVLGFGGQQKVGPQQHGSRGAGLAAVACGLGHTAAVLETGALYTWGSGTYGQLGYPVTAQNTAQAETSSSSSSSSSSTSSSAAAASEVELVVATPRRVPLTEPVAAVACGWRHTTALGAIEAQTSPGDAASQLVHVFGSLKPDAAATTSAPSSPTSGVGCSAEEEPLPPGHSRSGPAHLTITLPPAQGPVTALASGPWHTVWCPGLPCAPPPKPARREPEPSWELEI